MGAFDFSVMAGDEGRVPVDVAGSVMVNVQRLVYRIGEYSIAKGLCFQGGVPGNMLSRFKLYVDGSNSSVSSSAGLRFDDSNGFFDEVLTDLVILLDNLRDGSLDNILVNYPDPRYRIPIMNAVLGLSEDLEGNRLIYSVNGHLGQLSELDMNMVSHLLYDDPNSCVSDVPGVLRMSKGALFLEMPDTDVELEYDGGMTLDDHSGELINEPCIVSGRAFFTDMGKIYRITEIYAVTELPHLLFERVISSERDLELSGQLIADVEHDGESWTLSSDQLGISVSKQCLDDAILEFHDDFIFMWELYNENDDESKDELSDDEIRLRNYMMSLVKQS